MTEIILPNENNENPVKLSKEGFLDKAIKERRFKMIPLTLEGLIGILNSKKYIKMDMEGLPEDALILAANIDPHRGCFILKIVSSSFEPIKAGTELPIIEGTVSTKEDK